MKACKFIELNTIKANGVETNEQFLFIKSEYKIRSINFADVLFLWAKIECRDLEEGIRKYVLFPSEENSVSFKGNTNF